jgi:hypothetical protein
LELRLPQRLGLCINSDCCKLYKHFSLCLKQVFFYVPFSGQGAFTCPVFFCFISLFYLHSSLLQLMTYKLTWHEAIPFWLTEKKYVMYYYSFLLNNLNIWKQSPNLSASHDIKQMYIILWTKLKQRCSFLVFLPHEKKFNLWKFLWRLVCTIGDKHSNYLNKTKTTQSFDTKHSNTF